MLEIILAKAIWACAVCYGDPQSMVVKGMNYGIITMLLVLSVIMGLLINFFMNFRKRVKQMSIP